MHRPGLVIALGWVGFGLVVQGCAAPTPAWTGGSTTPSGRTDIALGGAARLPVGALRDDETSAYRSATEAQGLAPVALSRYGMGRHHDIGLMLSGTTLSLSLRGELGVREGSTRTAWVWGVAPFAGWIADRERTGRGGRVGADVPFAWGADFGGVYDVWFGARVGAERAFGDFALASGDASATATALRVGGFFGLAAGFRRVHAFVELGAAFEHWWAEHDGQELDRGGLVLTPSFGMRLRL